MPRGDKTGPLGQGPMTGRAAGLCTGNIVPGYMHNTMAGAGFGRGMGRGRFFCKGGRGFFSRFKNIYQDTMVPLSPEQERNFLNSQLQILSTQLDEINRRLNEIENNNATTEQEK